MMDLRRALFPVLSASVALALLMPATASAQNAAAKPSDRYYSYQLNHIARGAALKILQSLEYAVVPAESKAAMEATALRPVVVALPEPSSDDTSALTSLAKYPAGGALQRLLIVWDAEKPEDLKTLLRLLHERVDQPARQIRIEALILELDRDRIKDLGVAFKGTKDGQTFDFSGSAATPFTYTFMRPSIKSVLDLTVSISALVQDGSATVLSQPSVLVLDGRQARINVGDQTPFTQILPPMKGQETQVVSTTTWIKTGITLQLIPRATEDGSEVTMNVQVDVSESGSGGMVANAVLGPPIATRNVKTMVRVNNNTPFIIGGLISELDDDQRSGIPVLSKIPGLGKLFRRSKVTRRGREVIVVITPRVIPLGERAFSFSVADDTDLLDQFGLELFPNVYRIKSDDVYDLGFVTESPVYRRLRRFSERFAARYVRRVTDYVRRTKDGEWPPVALGDKSAVAEQMRRAVAERPPFVDDILADYPGLGALNLKPLIELFEGRIPGEDVLVQRMLLEIVEDRDYGRHVQPQKILYFASGAGGGDGQPQLELQRLLPRLKELDKGCNTVSLDFDREPDGDRRFDPPTAVVGDAGVLSSDATYVAELRRRNRRGEGGSWSRMSVLLNKCYQRRGGRSTLEMLRSVLALKRVLDVNPSLPLNLDAFHVGREVVFPDAQSLESASHVVDRRAAELFYETLVYYPAFEEEFDQAVRGIQALLDGVDAKAKAQANAAQTK